MATIIKTDGQHIEMATVNLHTLQNAVGGYIEGVYLRDGRCMYVNEEGLLKRLPLNLWASELANQPIVGNAVLLTHEETKADEEG
jgi:hypothetical protein